MSILKKGFYASSRISTNQNYLTFSSDNPFSISFTAKHWDGVLEYSVDAQHWYAWDASEISSVNNVLYLRGLGNTVITNGTSASYAMTMTSPTNSGISCTGNIMTLLDYKSPEAAVVGVRCFAYMFRGCTNLTAAPELPATTLAVDCYRSMFHNCTNLTAAPELPATTLAVDCYRSMFYNCTNLTVAPELPATVLAPYCYAYMLHNCTNLTVAPELPATALEDSCYRGMLRETGIAISETQSGAYQTPWRIPSVGTIATGTPTNWNTNMLLGTSGTFTGNPTINTTYYQVGEPEPANYLTFSSDAPFSIKFNQKSWDGTLEYSTDAQNWYEWDASEIYSSGNVLYLRGSGNSYITGATASSYAMQITATSGVECTGNIMTLLDHVNPDNAVMGVRCFAYLFTGQGKLVTSPELPATVLATSCYFGMFRGSGITVAPELPATTLAIDCYAYMFYNGTSLTTAPELPATVLANSCYTHMFYGCESLEVAPELPATVLAEFCYRNMFYGSGIAISETQTGIYQTPWRIPSEGAIASDLTGWNTGMLGSTNGTFTSNPDINTTYYQAN
jgi:hypothetical protein